MKIPGGYYLKARKVQSSEIAHAPPHVREIWDWLIMQANHKDNAICKRGQCYRTYKDMQDGLAWFIGYRKMTYKKHHCEKAMKWLKKATMVTTAKTTRGMLITVLNYDIYQTPENYESYTKDETKATMELQGVDTINKNDKNEKNDKKRDKDTCPYEEILSLYHSILDGLPLIAKLSSGLKKKIKARWVSDADRRKIEWWRWYFEGVAKCDFLMGRTKDWSANFHWLIGPENMDKVLSGQYTNRNKTDSAIEDWINE